jgi:hypothetical protein
MDTATWRHSIIKLNEKYAVHLEWAHKHIFHKNTCQIRNNKKFITSITILLKAYSMNVCCSAHTTAAAKYISHLFLGIHLFHLCLRQPKNSTSYSPQQGMLLTGLFERVISQKQK